MRVVDLTAGEAIPRDVLDALTDDGVTKWAFNANLSGCAFPGISRIWVCRWIRTPMPIRCPRSARAS